MSGSVSERARTGIDYFVAQAARSSLAATDSNCTLEATDEPATGEHQIVMLTVSSYHFRVLVFIHFNSDPGTRGHFATLDHVPIEEMRAERFNDAVMERGNLMCGALNRELAEFYPHMGMSTPCMLHRSSIAHVDAVKPALTHRYRAEVSEGVALHFTVAVCAFGDLDFPFEPRAADEIDTAGELEMF